MLQLKISHVKIASCVQYLNGYPLYSCPHQANHRACVPVNVPWISFLMKLNINCVYIYIYIYIQWTYEYCLRVFQSILESILLLKTAHVQLRAVSHFLFFGVLLFSVENGSFIGEQISFNFFAFGLSVGWKSVRKYASH